MNNIFIRITFIIIILFCFSYAQNSIIKIHGTGDPNTSSHIKIGAQGNNKSYIFTGEIVVEDSASLEAWSPSAIGDAVISGDGQVVFLSELPDNYDIYVIDLQTNVVRQLTSIADAGEYNPSWSPQDLKIAHDVVRGDYPYNGAGEEHAIYITDVSTGVSAPLVGAEGGNDAAWSPDGSKIAFDRSPLDDPKVYTVPHTGGSRQMLINDAVDPGWSPIGNKIVFFRPSNGSIYTANKNGHGTKKVADGFQPVWAPNGKWIAFVHNNDIWKIKVNRGGKPKGQPINLTNDSHGDWQPAWSMDGNILYFHSNRNGDADIYSIPASGGTPTKITGIADYGEYDPSISNSGQQVAYSAFTEPVIENLSSLATFIPTAGNTVLNKVALPEYFKMDQNYPNPFNPETKINFQLPKDEFVNIRIHSILGQEIFELTNRHYQAGYHHVIWNGKDKTGNKVTSGIYVYHIKAGKFEQVKKMILLK